MNCFVNNTMENITIHNDCVLLNAQKFNISAIFLWLFSRLRIFLYLSSPYEESFEFEHQVADYHTEVNFNNLQQLLQYNNLHESRIGLILFSAISLAFNVKNALSDKT